MTSIKKLKTGIKRLTILVDHLENNVKKKNFDLSSWANIEGAGPRMSAYETVCKIREGSCGTTACALGHAALIPEFNKKGLTVFTTGVVNYGHLDAQAVYANKHGQEFWNEDAGAQFFKISLNDAENLFFPDNYPEGRRSKYYVVRRLKAQIKKMNKVLTEKTNEQASPASPPLAWPFPA